MPTNKDDNEDDDDDDDDTSQVSSTEAMEMLLGGIQLGDLSMSAWEHVSDKDEENDLPPDKSYKLSLHNSTPMTTATTTSRLPDSSADSSSLSFKAVAVNAQAVFARAYTCRGYCTRDGHMEHPPVQIVQCTNASSHDKRGNFCVATRPIQKGQVIFTERAAVAASVAPSIRACPQCLRSLEPASSCGGSNSDNSKDVSDSAVKTTAWIDTAKTATIPMPHLWPVPEFHDTSSLEPFSTQGSSNNNNNNIQHDHLFRDVHRRIYCANCHVWFCNPHCLAAYERDVGVSHCVLTGIQRALHHLDAAAPVILATHMFVRLVRHYRETKKKGLQGTCFEGLCGEAADVGPLELGVETEADESLSSSSSSLPPKISLQPVYQLLVKNMNLSRTEQDEMDLTVLEQLSAMAARNSVGFRTKSPFKTYHAALLRNAGGWGSLQHQTCMDQLARALGRTALDRNMDYEIEERVAPAVAGLFTLTARLNHSCQPNAEIQSQVFVDSHIDVVATRDIAIHEEVTISYLGPTARVRQSSSASSSTARRRRELRAKYLFDCACPLCC